MAITKNNVEEAVKESGGTNAIKIGEIKSRHRKRSQQGCEAWLHGWHGKRRRAVVTAQRK